MKKVLILAYDFPPYISVGGLRPYNWFKYIREFNIEPIVVTRQWDNKYGTGLDYIAPGTSPNVIVEDSPEGRVIRAPFYPHLGNRLLLKYGEHRFRLFRKMIGAYYEVFQYLWNVGPKKNVYIAANDYLSKNKVDLIIATGDPFVLFSYASKLSQKYQVPWVADYRDPWSLDISMKSKPFFKAINGFFEKRILRTAKHVVTVSEFMITQIPVEIDEKKISVITNGYDAELTERIGKTFLPAKDVLNIGFVGTVYNWHPLSPFLKTIAEIIQAHPDIKLSVNFYGTNAEQEIKKIMNEQYPSLMGYVALFPKESNERILEKLAGNNLLLLFNYYSYMGTKIYDYLGLKRPILFCYSNDPEANGIKKQFYKVEEDIKISQTLQEDLIRETESGYIVENNEQLKKVIPEIYRLLLEEGKISCSTKNIDRYSRKYKAQTLANLINDLTNG